MSFDRRESSNDLSVSGFPGTSHAVTIVVVAGISTPARSGMPFEVLRTGARWHAVAATVAARIALSACLRNIAAAWLITIPVCAGLAALALTLWRWLT